MRALTFTVVGVAVTQGSHRAHVIPGKGDEKPRAVVTHDRPGLGRWRQTIGAIAAIEMHKSRMSVLEGAIVVEIVFHLPRPKAFRTKSTKDRDIPHTRKPDADKLARAAKDALSKVLWHDDAQVTDLIARKRYTTDGAIPRAVITVREYADSLNSQRKGRV